MRRLSRLNHRVILSVAAILILTLSSTLALFSVQTNAAAFSIVSVNWGTSSSPLEVGPGSINAPLTVTLQYLGTQELSRVGGILGVPGGMPDGITDTYGSDQAGASTGSVQPAAVFSLVYYLNIPPSFSVGLYSIPMEVQYNLSSTVSSVPGFYSEEHAISVKILGTIQMSAGASQNSLNAGEINNVTLTLTNRGTGTATQINPSLSTSVGSILTVLPVIQSLPGGASTKLQAQVYVPSSNAGSAVTLTLSTAYVDAYGASGTSSLPIGFYVVTVPEPLLTFSASDVALTPGQVNDVAVTLTNNGPGVASAIKISVEAPSGFSILNQFPEITSLQVGQSANTTLRVFAPLSVVTQASVSSAAGSAATLSFSVDYTDPYGYSQTTTQALGLYITSSVVVSSATSLGVTTVNNSLTEGQASPVSFVIKNTGQQPVYAPTISLTITSPLVVSVNSTITLAGATINPGSSVTYSADVTTGTSATGGFYAGDLSITYTDQLGDSHTQTVPVAFVVTLPVSQVSVSSLATQLSVGKSSTVSFMIANTGTAPIYSPTFSLTAPSGLAVTTNSTYSRSGLVINPGKSVEYTANVTSGPKTSEGAYIATLTVSYTDQFGNAHTSTFNVGLVAVGWIQMVIQNEVASFNGTIGSVSGTLLNEGVANAYYTEVTGTLTSGTSQLATGSSYVGEVDSNTPIPIALSITIPATALARANGTATFTLTATYQNDFGQQLQFKNEQRVSLSRATSGGSSTGTTSTGGTTVSAGTVDLVRYVALAAIVVAALATVIYVRRGRSKGKKVASKKSDVY